VIAWFANGLSVSLGKGRSRPQELSSRRRLRNSGLRTLVVPKSRSAG
jgi:hypothetical protein